MSLTAAAAAAARCCCSSAYGLAVLVAARGVVRMVVVWASAADAAACSAAGCVGGSGGWGRSIAGAGRMCDPITQPSQRLLQSSWQHLLLMMTVCHLLWGCSGWLCRCATCGCALLLLLLLGVDVQQSQPVGTSVEQLGQVHPAAGGV
jgi:hypothetical protein